MDTFTIFVFPSVAATNKTSLKSTWWFAARMLSIEYVKISSNLKKINK